MFTVDCGFRKKIERSSEVELNFRAVVVQKLRPLAYLAILLLPTELCIRLEASLLCNAVRGA